MSVARSKTGLGSMACASSFPFFSTNSTAPAGKRHDAYIREGEG